MKKVYKLRRLVPILLACFMALGAFAKPDSLEPVEYFVSAKTGNDGRSGSSWNSAFKTLKQAVQMAENSANPQVKIYLAEGDYNVGEQNAITYQGGSKSNAFYVLKKAGQKLWLLGGYPVPGSQTLPKDTCNNNPKRHVTRLVSTREMNTSVFRANNHNQALIIHGLTFDSKNFVGSQTDAALITFDLNGYDNPYFEMIDCSVNYYKSSNGGAIFFYGNMNNPKVKISRVEVLQGDRVGATGGGFLTYSLAHQQRNIQIDMSHVTFHDINHLGTSQRMAIIGATNGKPTSGKDNSYVHLDHIQVNRNVGGTAAQQITTFFLSSFQEVKVTNSIFRNTTAGLGGAFRVLACGDVLFENNQFQNCTSGDAGGAIALQSGGTAYMPNTTSRKATFINNDFENNTSYTAAGAIFVQDEEANSKVSVVIDNCNFKGNKGTGGTDTGIGGGGAVFIATLGDVNIKNSVFCNNSAENPGGAFRIKNSANSLSVTGCYFNNNSTNTRGNAMSISINRQKYNIANCVFANHKTQSGVGSSSGGAVSIDTGSGKITNCKFFDNESKTNGGAVNISGSAIYENAEDPIIFDKCLFQQNTSTTGGAIGQTGNLHVLHITNCIFDQNTALGWTAGGNDTGGGALSMHGSNGTEISNCTFTGNIAKSMGGVFYNAGGYIKSTNNRFYQNKAVEGGVVRIVDDNPAGSNNGFWSTDDVFYQNEATIQLNGGKQGTNNGRGGALFFYMSQGKTCEIKNAKFVENIADGYYKDFGSGGAIFYITNSASLTVPIIDKLDGCVFYGNKGLSDTRQLSATQWGADVTSAKTAYSIMNSSNTQFQLSANLYTSKLRFKSGTGNTYGNPTNPNVPATAEPIEGQGYTEPAESAISEGVKIDCKEIISRPEVDVMKPHADIITNDSQKKGISKTFASYCADDQNYWAKFQSIGGEGPFKFTYDVWKQKGNNITKIVSDASAETSDKKELVKKEVPNYVPTYDNDGNITGYEQKGTKIVEVEEYPDSVIVKGDDLIPAKAIEEGYLYTIIVKSLTAQNGEIISYDCVGDFDQSRQFAQNTGAQIFFKECTVKADDLDWDKDGILNYVECSDLVPANLTPMDLNTPLPSVGDKWTPYRNGIKTQQLFAEIVSDKNYLNANPEKGSRVLTLLPSVIGASSNSGETYNVDLSDKFGYPANSGAVVVTVHNFSIDKDRFRTTNDRDRMLTSWEISGTMHPYVLMQSTPVTLFHENNQFGINILTNENALSQTELYTKMDDDRYTVYETLGTKKIIINNKDANLVNTVGLSYLNTDPGKKYFTFSQSADQTGMVNTLVTVMLPCDDDMDGIPNFLDADSDGDGCMDAIEGGDDVTEEMVDDNGQIKGEVDKDGVPVAVNAGGAADKDGLQGQPAGTAYDDSQNACGNNYWTGEVDNDFNKKENWTNNVPREGQNIIFANGQEDAKGKVAVRDLHLPAGKVISANKLINNAPNEKFVGGAKEKTEGHPAVVVPADGGLVVKSVEGFNSADATDKLVMKTSENGKSVGTFILNNNDPCASTVFATVEFKPLGQYVRRRKGTDNQDATSPDYGKEVYAEFDWQYIGLPVKTATKEANGLYIRAYDEKKNDENHYYQKWTAIKNGDDLTAFTGYEVAPLSNPDQVRTFAGQLNLCEQTIDLTRQAAEVTAATKASNKRYGLGYNVIGNSFMAGVNVKNMKWNAGEEGVELDKTVYIYTTGSWEDWKNADGQSVKTKGGYEAIPAGVAGQNGLTEKIAPMQGFMVKFNNPTYSTTLGKLTIRYEGLESDGGELRAKSFSMESDYSNGGVAVMIDNEQVVDKFTMLQRQNATAAYDNGLDGEKLNMGEPSAFGTTTDAKNVQVMTVPSILGSAFNVETAKGKHYTMNLTSMDLDYEHLKLIDMKNKTVTPFVDDKAAYFFTGDVDGIEANRFVFVDTPETDFAKIVGAITGIDNITTTLTKGTAEIFDLSGSKVGTFSLPLDADALKGQLPAGVYLIKATDGSTVETRKYVVK